MSTDDNDHEDLRPSNTPGYKPSAAKTAEEYAKLDAEDESLARWKASLGLTAASSGNASGPKVTVLTLELVSSTLPAGKTISIDLSDPAKVAAETKKNPVVIKEGIEYNVRIKFRVNHSIISGVRYIQVVKRAGVKGASYPGVDHGLII
ncbi:immunoglobulin E-set [Lentinula aff. detonsa]|nr:immunoglobulin E-set [Lentinula aff. detonsa]